MSIKEEISAALATVTPNAWAVELPSNPTWPAIVFEIDTTPETGWVAGGGYDRHAVTIVLLAKTQEQIETLQAQVDQAMPRVVGFMTKDDHTDGDYEADASVYAYVLNYTIRKRK